MMNHQQYELVCQAKNEVLAIIQVIQNVSVQNAQRGLPIPVIPPQLLHKLRSLQDFLLFHQVRLEHFNLSAFAAECLKNADEQLVNYLKVCSEYGHF